MKNNKALVGKEVWVTCRAARPCGGNSATILLVKNMSGGGRIVRYQCKKCKRKFNVRV